MKKYEEIMDRGTCRNVQHDPVEHHWNLKGAGLGLYRWHRGN
jgi:hypothetical protein